MYKFALLIFGCLVVGTAKAQTILERSALVEITQPVLSLALEELSQQYEIRFFGTTAAHNTPVNTLSSQERDVKAALDELLSGTDLRYRLFRKQAVMILTAEEFTQLEGMNKQFYAALNQRLASGVVPEEVITVGGDEPVGAGQKARIVGLLTDTDTNDPIVGATVYWPELGDGTVSDSRGVWEMDVVPGEYDLQIQYIGYGNFSRRFQIVGYGFLDMKLKQTATELATVIVLAEANDDNVTNLQAGVSTFSVKRIEALPTLLGEADIVRSVLTSAGVSTIGEGASGFNVRGGAVDQNLILQGNSVLFNASHALGFYSTINPEVVENVSLYKSILPAEYGGRLSSVLKVDLRSGSSAGVRVAGGIGPVSVRGSFEGPIGNKGGAYLVSGRYASANWILKRIEQNDINRSTAQFYDLNLLLDIPLNEDVDLSLSLYDARDDFSYNREFGFSYLSSSAEVGLRRRFRKDFYAEGSLVGNRLRNDRQQLTGTERGTLSNGINYYQLKGIVGREGEKYHWKAGLEAIRYQLPGQSQAPLENSLLPSITLETEQGQELALFAENDWAITDQLSLRAGVRLNTYQYLGGKTLLAYANEGSYLLSEVIDTLRYNAGQIIEAYYTLEPRLSLRYQLSSTQSVRAGYARSSQFVNQVFNTDTPTPQSQFQLSTPYIQPLLANNFSVGYFQNFRRNRWETSVELFFRDIFQLWDYRDFAQLNLNPHLETELLPGIGRAYGLELSVRGRGIKYDMQLTYTLSRTEQQVADINQSDWYPNYFDQPHNLNFTFKYSWDKQQSLNANFVYASGRPTTAPLGAYVLGNNIPVPIYTERNQLRIPDYYRLDLSYNIAMKPNSQRRLRTSWDFTLYNVLGRRNPFSVFYTQEISQTRNFRANRLSILGTVFPALSLRFEFQ